MLKQATDSEPFEEMDDIESELVCSTREASAGYVAFANLVLEGIGSPVAHFKPLRVKEEVRLTRLGCTERATADGPLGEDSPEPG